MTEIYFRETTWRHSVSNAPMTHKNTVAVYTIMVGVRGRVAAYSRRTQFAGTKRDRVPEKAFFRRAIFSFLIRAVQSPNTTGAAIGDRTRRANERRFWRDFWS